MHSMQSLMGSVRSSIRNRLQHHRSKSHTGNENEGSKTSTKSSNKAYVEIQDNGIALASMNERQFDDIEGQNFGNNDIRFSTDAN